MNETLKSTFISIFAINGLLIIITNMMLIYGIWSTKQKRTPSRVEGMMITLSVCDLLVGFGCTPANIIFLYVDAQNMNDMKYTAIFGILMTPSFSVTTILTIDR